ncbi:MAG: hypothetical protein EA366_14740, partial [Spirulina sp. DLM2.Bin59]
MDPLRDFCAWSSATLLLLLPLPVLSQTLPPQTTPSPAPTPHFPLPNPPTLDQPAQPRAASKVQCVINTATDPQTLLAPIPTAPS